MSVSWRYLRSCITALALLAGIGASESAFGFAICIDPGHGGTDGGSTGGPCAEKQMNAEVGLTLYYLLINDGRFYNTQETHVGADVTMTLTERVDFANNMNASSFVSVHHNSPAVTERSYAMYDTTSQQQSYWTQSLNLAFNVANDVCSQFISHYPSITCDASCVDQAASCGGERKQVLYSNPRWATIGEASPTGGVSSTDLCHPSTSQATYWEAQGYYYGIARMYGVTSVGTSFTASGGSGVDTLRWVESEPTRVVVYSLWRSDACWGPYTFLENVVSQDPTYTNNNRDYTYIDRTVAYRRPYFYQLRVLSEVVDASATPLSLPFPSLPTPPTGLAGSGVDRGGGRGTVSLTWNPGAGSTGHYVYRSRYVGMADCNATNEYLGVATSAAFEDTTAPTGIQLYYRVRAFNATGGSDVSNQLNIVVARVVGVRPYDVEIVPSVRLLGANPTSDVVQLQYGLPANSRALISVFNVSGKWVATIVDEFHAGGGMHRISWGGVDSRGQRVASGVYFVRMSLGGRPSVTRRVVLLR